MNLNYIANNTIPELPTEHSYLRYECPVCNYKGLSQELGIRIFDKELTCKMCGHKALTDKFNISIGLPIYPYCIDVPDKPKDKK